MHFMNKQRGRHMGASETQSHEPKPSGDVSQESGAHQAPHIHIHSHSEGHTVHVMHHDGRHEKHEHAHGDSDGIAEHIHRHLGGGEGQDHGYSSGSAMEDEHGSGPGV